MLGHVWMQLQKRPMVAAAVLIFTAIVTLALCGLHSGMDAAQEQYGEIYRQVDVRCTVTNLAGDQSEQLYISTDIISLFTDPSKHCSLAEFVEDVQMKGTTDISYMGESYVLVGITSIQVDARLRPENECTIFWNDGKDEYVFGGSEVLCIIPRALEKKMKEVELASDIFELHISADNMFETDFDGQLAIAGTYQGKNENTIYCPWETYVAILRGMGRPAVADSLYATVRDNRDLPLLRETAAEHFAQPDPNAAGLDIVGDYFLALDINDSQLTHAKTNLDNSLKINRIAVGLIFILTTAAGAFIAFLVIRSRKKEILLMRTLGMSNGRIYLSIAAEQLLGAILGTFAGGVKFAWNPVMWLVVFVFVYYAGLSAAILNLLHKNLLSDMKEE